VALATAGPEEIGDGPAVAMQSNVELELRLHFVEDAVREAPTVRCIDSGFSSERDGRFVAFCSAHCRDEYHQGETARTGEANG
jgi:hypothetical protein